MSELTEKITSKVKDLAAKNKTLARQKCTQADNCLVKFRRENNVNKQLVADAINLYKEAAELNSQEEDAYIGLAYITYSTGDIKKAIGLLNTAQKIAPQNPKIEEMMAIFHQDIKDQGISSIISKAAGKSLAEKLDSGKPPKININLFEKLTMVFVKKMGKSETKAQPAARLSSKPDDENTLNSSTEVKPTGNFFETLKQAKKN